MPFDQTGATEQVVFLAPSIRCAGCIAPIEKTLLDQPGVLAARVNLTTKRINITLDPALTNADHLLDALGKAGHDARTQTSEDSGDHDRLGRDLLLRVGVAGFAAMNVMLLSISVWSGADGTVRDLMHWVSALIALPAIAYAGMPFFRSAFGALRHGRMNMDVPITLAIALAAASSLFETSNSGKHAFFDAGIMLIFFLLVGRFLEHRMRARAHSAAAQLLQMTGRYATRILTDGAHQKISVRDITQGMTLLIPAGARVPADGEILRGRSELDCALITGESAPVAANTGDGVLAGVLNLSGPIEMVVNRAAGETHLAEISRLIEAAERGTSRFDRIADRAAQIYAPVVHILAAIAFGGWLWATGDVRLSIQIAAAVLIITCPCALALAIPTVQMAAGAWLFRHGIFLKSGDALERLAAVDTVILDKTGTVTTGVPTVAAGPDDDDPAWAIALALCAGSSHPYSSAIAARAAELAVADDRVTEIQEHPGDGISGRVNGQAVKLGRPDWIGIESDANTVLLLPDGTSRAFRISQELRPDAVEICGKLRQGGLTVKMLSGDRAAATEEIGRSLGIAEARGELSPQEKHGLLRETHSAGHRVLMVGDGLNDTPALAESDVSMAPSEGADITQNLADIVFTGRRLAPVATAIGIAKLARTRGAQSIGLALAYNAIAVPIALFGLVTPLVAAIAMSASSLVVVMNAMRKGDSQWT